MMLLLTISESGPSWVRAGEQNKDICWVRVNVYERESNEEPAIAVVVMSGRLLLFVLGWLSQGWRATTNAIVGYCVLPFFFSVRFNNRPDMIFDGCHQIGHYPLVYFGGGAWCSVSNKISEKEQCRCICIYENMCVAFWIQAFVYRYIFTNTCASLCLGK